VLKENLPFPHGRTAIYHLVAQPGFGLQPSHRPATEKELGGQSICRCIYQHLLYSLCEITTATGVTIQFRHCSMLFVQERQF
jgi:hypothetical protein